jgi:hypothetical protein
MESDITQFLKGFLNKCNIHFDNFSDINGIIIPREVLLNEENYNLAIEDLSKMKKIFSSSYMTSLQTNAKSKQKFPLINLVRQVLKNINFSLVPIRKSNGYTKTGKKIYQRFFQIVKIKSVKDKAKELNEEQSAH